MLSCTFPLLTCAVVTQHLLLAGCAGTRLLSLFQRSWLGAPGAPPRLLVLVFRWGCCCLPHTLKQGSHWLRRSRCEAQSWTPSQPSLQAPKCSVFPARSQSSLTQCQLHEMRSPSECSVSGWLGARTQNHRFHLFTSFLPFYPVSTPFPSRTFSGATVLLLPQGASPSSSVG